MDNFDILSFDPLRPRSADTYVKSVMESTKLKSLKIPKGQSETVYRRRTDDTIAKRKSTKGQTLCLLQ